jgi:hypothetical protein
MCRRLQKEPGTQHLRELWATEGYKGGCMILAAFLFGVAFGAVGLLALGLAASAGQADDFLEAGEVYRLEDYR